MSATSLSSNLVVNSTKIAKKKVQMGSARLQRGSSCKLSNLMMLCIVASSGTISIYRLSLLTKANELLSSPRMLKEVIRETFETAD